jgi:hypothetical protein
MFLCKAAYQKRLKPEQSWEILPPSILSLIIEYADITLKMDDKIVASQYSKRGPACSIIFKSVLITKFSEISRETCKIEIEGDSISNDDFLNIISKLKNPTHISIGAREFDSTLLSKYLPNLKGVTFSGYKNFFLSRHFPLLKQIDVRANFNQRPFYVGPNVTDLTMRFKKCKTGTFDSASKITKLDHLRFIQIVDPLATTFTKFGPVVEPYLRFLENCQVNRLYIEAISFPSASLKHVPNVCS